MRSSKGSFSEDIEGDECIFCPNSDDEQSAGLFTMMNQALISKHSSNSNNQLINGIDILLKIEQPASRAENQDYCKFKQFMFLDQQQQNMRRWYRGEEFQNKIKMLSQYYKFHKDIPRVVQSSIQRILGKYHDRKRQYDYKCIKKLLKQQQGLSITSVESSGSENSDTVEQKSKYSTLLNALNQKQQKKKNTQILMSDSNLLQQICRQIGRALPKTKIEDEDFKGVFFESEKKFQNYVKKQQNRRNKRNQLVPHRPIGLKRNMNRQSRQQIKMKNTYFNLQKNKAKQGHQNYQRQRTKKFNNQNHDTIKLRNFNMKKSQKNQRSDHKYQRSQQKRKFIYNTNIKIQIKNAMFYPDQFNSNVGETKTTKSRKSIIGKIAVINDDKYRTPVTKIYQPQDTESANRYKKRSNIMRKQRLRTKQSRENNEKVTTRPKRVVSSHNLRKMSIEKTNDNKFLDRQKHFNSRTVSVGKLKVENNRYDNHEFKIKPSRGTYSQQRLNFGQKLNSRENLKRQSINMTHGNSRHQSIEKLPLAKYNSSQMKDQRRSRGTSIKQLLTKKLNIYER